VYLGKGVILGEFDRIVAAGEVFSVDECDILETGDPHTRPQIGFVKVHDLRWAIAVEFVLGARYEDFLAEQ
jgi:hypothetical protein